MNPFDTLRAERDSLKAELKMLKLKGLEGNLTTCEEELEKSEAACAHKTELLRAIRHSMDTDKPFPKLENITAAINDDCGAELIERLKELEVECRDLGEQRDAAYRETSKFRKENAKLETALTAARVALKSIRTQSFAIPHEVQYIWTAIVDQCDYALRQIDAAFPKETTKS